MPKMHKSVYTMRLTSSGQCNHWRIRWRNENSNLPSKIGLKSVKNYYDWLVGFRHLSCGQPKLHHLRILNQIFEFSKVTARVQSNYFPTDLGCRLLPPPQSNISDTTLNYRIETYYNNDDLVPDFIPKNSSSSNLDQVKEDLFGNFGSFKNVRLQYTKKN